jgi:hypothetical protein
MFTDFGWPLHIITNKQTKKLIRAASFVCSLFVCCAASFVFVCSLGYPHPQNLTSLRREYPSANFVENSSGPHSCIGEGYRNHTNSAFHRRLPCRYLLRWYFAKRCTLKQTGENYEETNSDHHAWRCRYARHDYRFIREKRSPDRWLPVNDGQSRLRRLSRRLLRIADIALILTAKPPDHRAI